MSKKYKRILSFIVVLLVLSFSLGTGYFLFDKSISSDFKVIKEGNLSINYLGGNNIVVKNESKQIEFSVTNDSDNVVTYAIFLADIKNFNEEVSMQINTDGNTFNIDAPKETEKKILNNIRLESKHTKKYILNVESDNNQVSFDIIISEEENSEETFSKTILKNNEVNITKTIVGRDAAVENEGLISDIDDNGVTYYFRGSIDNNYVAFADLNWRIVRINGDGSIRLVLDKAIDLSSIYTSNISDYSYKVSEIKTALDNWYQANLESYSNFITVGKFCNDSELVENSPVFNAYTRTLTEVNPTFNCLGEKIGEKIGLLSIDEVMYAGTSISGENKSYYLYKDGLGSFWTMSGARFNESAYYPFLISNGSIRSDVNSNSSQNIRPVINIINKAIVTGTGTENDPYKLK